MMKEEKSSSVLQRRRPAGRSESPKPAEAAVPDAKRRSCRLSILDNQFVLSGKLIELDALRYTPAGIPVVNFRLSHESEQIEAGAKRARCSARWPVWPSSAKRA